MTDKDLRRKLDALALNAYIKGQKGEDYYSPDKDIKHVLGFINQHTKTIVDEAETVMGEAVIERNRQANHQWEKVESFIQTYQLQKEENMHNLKSLQRQRAKELLEKRSIT